MAIKHVQETLGQFEDWKYFSLLESKKEERKKKVEENSSDNNDIDEFKEEDEKDGLSVIQKLRDNLSRFVSAAGEKILKYKEFWEENSKATDSFDEEGELYKLWDSNYVAGVLNLPDEALSDEELTAEIAKVDDESPDEEDEEKDEGEKEDSDELEKDEEEEEDSDEEKEEDSDEEEEDSNELEKDEKEGEEIEEGNAFSGALKKAKDSGKKEFKVKGKTYPVKESGIPVGEDFLLNEEEKEDEEEELPIGDEETPEGEKETKVEEPLLGFDPGGKGEEEATDEFTADDEVEVKDGEAIELEGDLDADGEVEGGMEFEEEGMNDYFVVYDMSGSERDEVFRTDSPKVIEDFKTFFENEFKASIKEQIQKFKEAQEEKKREAERLAKEEIRKERKGKLEKFMKD